MSMNVAVARGRRHARRLMVDRIDIGTPTGGWTENQDGDQVATVTPLNVDLPALIKALPQQSRIVEVGGKPVTLFAYDVLLPHDTEGLAVEQLVTVKSSSGTDLQGRSLTVVDVTWGSFQIARRLVCRAQL